MFWDKNLLLLSKILVCGVEMVEVMYGLVFEVRKNWYLVILKLIEEGKLIWKLKINL